jgi:hypothetical protein
MKKIILIILLGLIFSVGTVHAAIGGNLVQREVKIASRAAARTLIQSNISQDLRQRAQTEITRRLGFLNQLLGNLSTIKKLSAAEIADLQSQVQAQIDGLDTLQTKINADTDNTTLKADVKSIINDYYIFLFFREKVNLLVSADKMSTTTNNFSQIYAKLQTRINQAQAAGNDVTQLNVSLSDMNAKVADAKTQIAAAQAELTPLTAQGYPGNKSTLTDARTKLKVADQDLKSAYKDIIVIRQALEGLKIKNPEASTSAH